MRKGVAVSSLLIVMAGLLAGCGQSSASAVTYGPGANAVATTTATTAPAPVATNGVVISGHSCETNAFGQTNYVQIGDLKVTKVHFTLAYPAMQLPSSVDTSRPFQLPSTANNPPNPPVNPRVANGVGYGIIVCNTSSTTGHVIVGITATIADFTPFSGTLNAWQFCDGFYQRPYGAAGGGCGGAYPYDEALQASFATNAAQGAQVIAAQVGTSNNAGPGPNTAPLPVSLGPGQMLVFSLGVTPPTAPGTYTFAFGLNYDNVTAAPISTMQPTIFDSVAVKWNGQNCAKPALLSQIPTTDTQNRYVCAP